MCVCGGVLSGTMSLRAGWGGREGLVGRRYEVYLDFRLPSMSSCCIPEPAALAVLLGPAAQLDGRSYSLCVPICVYHCLGLLHGHACVSVGVWLWLRVCLACRGGAWPKLLHGVNVPRPN